MNEFAEIFRRHFVKSLSLKGQVLKFKSPEASLQRPGVKQRKGDVSDKNIHSS